jgi:sugar phosphate isomerase/epimerase
VGGIDIRRLSLNQYTTPRWTLPEAVKGCAAAGVPAIGVWRDKIGEHGLAASARLLREAGITVSSLCRGGFFTARGQSERREKLDDNCRALDEAATLGTSVLVLVCGGVVGSDIEGSRAVVEESIAELVPHAASRGVKLGIEPLHPMFAADRSVIVSLAQANELIERLDSDQVGLIIDAYHVWWDPQIYSEIARAAGRILGFHVNDWLAPMPHLLLGRGMMGDGVIELRRIRSAVDSAGYAGPIEVEIFNQAIWDMPGGEVLDLVVQRYREYLL